MMDDQQTLSTPRLCLILSSLLAFVTWAAIASEYHVEKQGRISVGISTAAPIVPSSEVVKAKVKAEIFIYLAGFVYRGIAAIPEFFSVIKFAFLKTQWMLVVGVILQLAVGGFYLFSLQHEASRSPRSRRKVKVREVRTPRFE